MSPRPISRERQPGIDLHVRDIARDLGVSGHGITLSYDRLLDWAIEQYWLKRRQNRPVQDVA